MKYTFFNQKIENGVNDLLAWFGINLKVSFQDTGVYYNSKHVLQFGKKSHIQLTLKFTTCISTWSLLLSYIDDTLIDMLIEQYVTKSSMIRHLPHHHGIFSKDFQCHPKVDLGLMLC